MSYCKNKEINKLIESCGGYFDFRDIVFLENCKSKDISVIHGRMRSRHFERKRHGYKNIK